MKTPLLRVEALTASYGAAKVLFDVSFEVGEGEVVTILGRNGMGKTTTVRSIVGLHGEKAGRIWISGRDVTKEPPYRIAQAGIGLVPEGRQIFPTLSVEENLIATAATRQGRTRWTLAEVYKLFPRLEERQKNLGTQLSGGEQQMLAVGRALLTNPRLLILDEATEGLAPLIRLEIWHVLKQLKREGQSIIVIDKNIDALSTFADQHVVIEKGHVVWTGSTELLKATPAVKDDYLHI